MKKVVLSLALVATMAFVSCKETEKEVEATPETEVVAPEVAPEVEATPEVPADSTVAPATTEEAPKAN